jgi:hypothetical protein
MRALPVSGDVHAIVGVLDDFDLHAFWYVDVIFSENGLRIAHEAILQGIVKRTGDECQNFITDDVAAMLWLDGQLTAPDGTLYFESDIVGIVGEKAADRFKRRPKPLTENNAGIPVTVVKEKRGTTKSVTVGIRLAG